MKNNILFIVTNKDQGPGPIWARRTTPLLSISCGLFIFRISKRDVNVPLFSE